jgi:YVTN family beta-propeller protein
VKAQFWANRRTRYSVITGGAAVIAAAAAAVALTTPSGAAPHKTAAAGPHVKLISSSCSGPAGAAYVSDAGWDGFEAVNTANCDIIQVYNVDDTAVQGFSDDYNYSSTDEGIAIHGDELYFADTGTNTVSAIDTADLDPSNYNPSETDIHVGFNPQELAVSPDGTQLWVANTGPQAGQSSPVSISVINTATDKVTATLRASGSPLNVAFSPSGADAYVLTDRGLYVYSTTTDRVVKVVSNVGDPHGIAVSADGKYVYVTDTTSNTLKVISTDGYRVTASIGVGDLPWSVVVSSDGKTAYVANPDSDSISVINTATDKVSDTIDVAGGPSELALTADGSQLWTTEITNAYTTVIDTAGDSVVGSLNLGDDGANSGDGYGPNGIVLSTTPTPGS